jgi:hypothetical protein
LFLGHYREASLFRQLVDGKILPVKILSQTISSPASIKKYGRVFGAKWSPVFGIWQRLGWQKTGDTLLVDI